MPSTMKRTPISWRRLVLSSADYSRLVGAIASDLAMAILTEQELKRWKARLSEARIMEAHPTELVVSMNSLVQLLDVDSGVRETFRLVFPQEASICEGNLSVLSPKGELLLGSHLGEALLWTTVNGGRRLYLEAIRPPIGLNSEGWNHKAVRTIESTPGTLGLLQ